MTPKRTPRYQDVDGLLMAESYLPEAVRSASTFKLGPDDTVVASYPKCGTTWICQILKLILEKGDHSEMTPNEYFKCFPFFEFRGVDGVRNMLKPGCIKTHLSFDRLNFSEEAKYIYITRHPRDCVVSFFHHTQFFPLYCFTDGTFDVFFDLFVEGKVDYNDYFDNLLSWYEQRHRPNILFLTYESIKADHRGTVLKIADFLGIELTEQQVDNVVKYSGFEYMKQETDNIFNHFTDADVSDKYGQHLMQITKKALEDGHRPVGNFMRKGVVGSGKLVLSEEQKERLKARILEKTQGSDVMSLWSDA